MVLVVIGADEQGRKELVGLSDGYRESEQSWRELLVDLRHRGLELGPELAIGDGNLGVLEGAALAPDRTRPRRS